MQLPPAPQQGELPVAAGQVAPDAAPDAAPDVAAAPDAASGEPLSADPQQQASEETGEEMAAESADESAQSTIVVEATSDHPPGDPMVRINEQTYTVVAEIDDVFVEPVAMAYGRVLPDPVRSGLSNFLRNLREPVIFLNFLLQGKFGDAFETFGRFAVNSTFGIAGLIDVAREQPFNLPFQDNGFADTLGYYGVDAGAFLYLPLVGPTTVRDLIGNTIDVLTLPTVVGKPFNTPYYAVSAYTIRSLDERLELDNRYRIIRESSSPYDLMRQIYLCERQAEIDHLRGREAEDCVDTFRLDELPPSATREVPADGSIISAPVDIAPVELVPAEPAPADAEPAAETPAPAEPAPIPVPVEDVPPTR